MQFGARTSFKIKSSTWGIDIKLGAWSPDGRTNKFQNQSECHETSKFKLGVQIHCEIKLGAKNNYQIQLSVRSTKSELILDSFPASTSTRILTLNDQFNAKTNNTLTAIKPHIQISGITCWRCANKSTCWWFPPHIKSVDLACKMSFRSVVSVSWDRLSVFRVGSTGRKAFLIFARWADNSSWIWPTRRHYFIHK